jgi:hypothetical protein
VCGLSKDQIFKELDSDSSGIGFSRISVFQELDSISQVTYISTSR